MPLPMFDRSADQPIKSSLSGVKKIIAIAAGKGGVGKSSVAVNLALALKLLNYQVGILDADLYGPSLCKMLPDEKGPSQKDSWIEPAESKGIKTISMGHFKNENEAAAVRAPIANGVIGQFIKNVNWGSLDYLIVDFPPGTGDVQLTLCQQLKISGAMMVTTPQEVALLDVRKAAALFNLVRIPILGVIENMSYFQPSLTAEPHYIFGKGGGTRLAQEWQVPFLGAIPLDPSLCRCGDEGLSLFELDPTHKNSTTKAFLECAKLVVAHSSDPLKGNALVIEKLWKQDDSHLAIQSGNGEVQSIRLSDLQRLCPCANCVDEASGKRISNPDAVDPFLKAKEIHAVGRYGLKIEFSSGCSNGIYSYDFLEGMRKQ